MDVRIKTTGFDMNDQLSVYLDERLAALDKFIDVNDTTARCEVEIGKTAGHSVRADDQWRAELNVSCLQGTFRTEATAATVNAAIDEAKDEMLRRLRRSKRRYVHLIRKTGARLKRMVRWGA